MELIEYIRLFRKWFWLLILGAFLAGGASYIIRSQQRDQYNSTVTISVGSYIQAPNPNTAEITTGVELAQTYAVLAKTYDVLEATVQIGNFPLEPDELSRAISTSVVGDTSLLKITVTYVDPVLAADMANQVARQLIASSPSNLTPDQQAQLDFNNAEIARLNAELAQARLEQADIDTRLATETDSAEIERLRSERNTVATLINNTSANIAQYAANSAEIQKRSNSLTVVEQARIPTHPVGAGYLSRTLLGAMVGLALAAGIALLIEYLDDTIRTPDDITQAVALPTLATISRFGKRNEDYRKRLVTKNDPGSHVSEQYRALRTNLLFAENGDWSKGGYIITSPGPSEGKSITAANMAVSMASAGLRVLLVDADLRRPRVHEIFGVSNEVGLSTLLFAEPNTLPAVGSGQQFATDITQCLQETDVPGLRVITSGYIPSNPTEVLGSVAMERWYKVFRAAKNVDVVLFDSPPVLVVADTAALAASTKAPVVLVVEAGQTRRHAAVRAKQQFDALDILLKGVVLNASDPRSAGYEYGYGDGYYYYYADSHENNVKKP